MNAPREFRADDYRRDGFFFPLQIMSAAEAAGHRRRLERAEARHGPMHYRSKPFLLLTSAMELGRHPRLLDAVEQIIGPDILLWEGAYIIKEAGDPRFVSWHQDLTYWGLDDGAGEACVSAWIALSEAGAASGCMRALPGTHARGKLRHRDTEDEQNILHRGQEVVADIDEAQTVDLCLAPGEASLHHGWVMHASKPNTGGDRRIGLNLQFLAPSVRQLVMKDDSATLVRGRDRHHHFRPDPAPRGDFDPAVVDFQRGMERRRREVWSA